MPVIDGHNDTLLRLAEHDGDPVAAFVDGNPDIHIDLPRAREGGLGAGLFASYVPNEGERPDAVETDEGYEYPLADAVDRERAKRITYETLALLCRLDAEVDGLRVVRSIDELDACLDDGTLGAIPHIEDAAAVEPDLSNLDLLYAAGVRSIGLVWSRPNAFGHGVQSACPSSPDTGPGLTDAGRDLVRACEERGVVVDLAHITEAGFWDVAERYGAPLVDSHTCAHALCPHSRNLTDEQLDAVGESGGLVGVAFAVSFLDEAGHDGDVPLSALVDHIEYIADRIGVEHVALGSDFDGTTVPGDVGDVTGLPAVLDALRERGFSERDVELIARDNWRRVLAETWTG